MISVSELNSTSLDQVSLDMLQKQGYLFIKGLLPVQDVKNALEEIKLLMKREDFLPRNSNSWRIPLDKVPETARNPSLLSRQEWISNSAPLMNLLEHKNLYEIMKKLISENEQQIIHSLPFKWLRAVKTDQFTGFHNDRVYVGHISDKLVTCWIPLTDVELERGSMIVLPCSNRIDRAMRLKKLYNDPNIVLKGDGTTDGWLTRDPNTILDLLDENDKLESSDFKQGDIIILLLDTMHMTARNVTDQWRVSCDTRWIAL